MVINKSRIIRLVSVTALPMALVLVANITSDPCQKAAAASSGGRSFAEKLKKFRITAQNLVYSKLYQG